MSLLIKNAMIVNKNNPLTQKDICVRDGVIRGIDDEISMDYTGIIDAEGCYAIPGLIDMYCNTRDPGFENKEDIYTASKSAAKGGFTTITCSPDTIPVIDNKTVVSYIAAKAKQCALVNIVPYGSMTKGNNGLEMSEIGEMVKAGIIAVSDGGKSISNSGVLRNILIYTKMFDIPAITFCEDSSIAGSGVVNWGLVSTTTGLTGIPREAEEIFVSRDILLAKHTGARLHISQISTRGSIELIREAKKSGVAVTCGTCPHYFSLTEQDVGSFNTLVKLRPPLRTQDDALGLIEGLVDGTIDVICTGHYPVGIEDKSVEFDRALYGISALETAFAVSHAVLVQKKLLTIEQLVSKMSANPSKILGLDAKGALETGKHADIVIIDLNKPSKIDASKFESKAKFSPFNGMSVECEIKFTIVGGKIVYTKDDSNEPQR